MFRYVLNSWQVAVPNLFKKVGTENLQAGRETRRLLKSLGFPYAAQESTNREVRRILVRWGSCVENGTTVRSENRRYISLLSKLKMICFPPLPPSVR